ncbi:T9SS type A sorting domain-containing protein [Flavobacterium sp. 3-210]
MKKTLLCFLLLFSTFFYAQVTSVSICEGIPFNLTSLKTDFIGNLNSSETTVTYFLSEPDALSNTNVIANPETYISSVGLIKIYGRIDNNGTITTNYFNLTTFPTINLTASHKPILCKGETTALSLSSSGGNAPYLYSVNGSAFTTNDYYNNLPAGTYNIEVKSQNAICLNTKVTYVVPEPTALVATAMVDRQNVIVTATGGTAPYQYSLDGISFQSASFFANLSPGSYNIRVKDTNGCIALVSTTVNYPITSNLTIVKMIDCTSNGTLTAYATGGQPPYVYSINGGAYSPTNVYNDLVPGTYIVTVKDATNTISYTNTITLAPPVPVDFVATNTPVLCYGGTASLTITALAGQAPYQYAISEGPSTSNNIFSSLIAGNYLIKVTDANGCINVKPYTITEPTIITGEILIEGQTISVTDVTGGTGSYFYSIDNGSFQANNVFTNVNPGLHHVRVKDSNNCEPGSFWAEITSPITATIAITKEMDCMSNAEVVVVASGGKAPYAYSINGTTFQTSNIFSNLTEGTYSFTVKDANGAVTATNSITIAPINFPTLTFTQTNVSCFQGTDGTIIVSATGGKAPYTYSINNSSFVNTNVFTNLVSGVYDIRIKDANGCLSSSYVAITEPTAITTTVSVKNSTTVGSNDGQITVTAIGGVSPYIYALTIDGIPSSIFQASNIFDGLKAGSYSVQVKDANGCIAMQAVSIIDGPPALVATATATQITCANSIGVIAVTATGGTPPYTYSFDDGVTYSASNTYNGFQGTYSIKVKDAENSQASTTITLITPTPIFATAILAKAIDCTSNGIISVATTGGQGPYLYSFDNGNTYSSNNTFSNAGAGVYTILVKDNYGCISDAQAITVDPLVPFLATATITKEVDCINGSFRVDVTGGKSPYLYSINNEPYAASVPLFYKQAGTYTINVKDNANCIATTAITLKPYTPVSATTIVTNATCFGSANGKVTVLAHGGVPPYTYSLDGTNYQTSNIFNNVVAKTYTIRIKDDKRCISNVTAIVTQPTSLAITSTIKSVTCKDFNNGSVTLAASGGKSPYTYSKDGVTYSSNPNFTALTAGVYTFFVRDANSCIVTNNSTVTEPNTLELITDIKTINNDGSIGAYIKLDAVGGTAPYLYSLKNQTSGISYAQNSSIKIYGGMSAGLYTISVVDANGCQVTKSDINITLDNPILLNTVKTPISCIANASFSVSASGGVAPYLYSYDSGSTYTSNNPGRTNLTPGNYSILLKDAIGNQAQTHFIVKAYAAPKMTAIVSYETSNNYTSGIITVSTTGGKAPYYYTVKGTSASRVLIENETSTVYSGLPADTYTVFSKDANGCESAKTEVTLTIPEPIVISASISAPLTCSNSTTTLTFGASGGTGPYLYSANGGRGYTSTGIYTVGAGTYILYVKDALGNTSWIKYIVKQYVPVTNTFIKTNVSCSGSQDGSVQFTASGGIAPYTYSLDQINYTSNNAFSNLKAGTYNGTVKDAVGCLTTVQFTITQPLPLTITNSVTNSTTVDSNDGKITVIASGGTVPYLYSLKNENGTLLTNPQSHNIFESLRIGKYTIETKDANGCITSTTGITITSTTLFGSLIVTPATCVASGSITINAAGGKYPLQYSFDNGITYVTSNVASNLNPGSYTIKVRDAEGTTITLFGTVTTPTPLVAVASSTSPIHCNGSKDAVIQVTVSGGKAPYLYSLNGNTYQASNIFSNLSAGSYVVMIKDSNECIFNLMIMLSEPDPLASTAEVVDQTITVNTTGGAGGYRYAISPNLNLFSVNNTFSNLSPGTYSIITSDLNGCYVIMDVVVDPIAPTINGQSNKMTVEFKPGQTLADLTIDGQDIKWYSTPGNSSSGKTSKSTAETPLPLTTVLVDGTTYYASQTINGIESKERLAVTAKVNGSLSAPDFNLTSFQFYPNPVKDILNIKNDSVIDDVEIIDISGKSVVLKKINDLHSEIDLSNLSRGIYILKVKSENRQKTIKFIKE